VILADVPPGTPAAKAGLEAADVVLTLDGKPMENGRQFRINIYSRGVGEQVAIDVRRGEQRLSLRVPVTERSSGTSRLESLVGPLVVVPRLGISAMDLTPAIAQILPPVRRTKGAVIVRVAPDAPFSQQGRLAPGDVVHTINGTPVQTAQELVAASVALPPVASVVLQIEREAMLYYIAFRVER
jgi:serine protease Do